MVENMPFLVTIVFSILLFVILMMIAIVDFASFRIPNLLNLLLALTGSIWQFVSSSEQLVYQALFATGLFLVFYSVQKIHTRITGKLGLGMGDVKMVGAAGFWISPFNLPFFVFIASLGGLIFALVKRGSEEAYIIPFGPFLALSLFVVWVWEIYL